MTRLCIHCRQRPAVGSYCEPCGKLFKRQYIAPRVVSAYQMPWREKGKEV